MHFYRLYGLIFQSAFQIINLAELSSVTQEPDVTIERVSDGNISDYVPSEVAQKPIAIQMGQSSALVYLKNTGVFMVQGGCKIILVTTQNPQQEHICQALLGVVLAILFHQRGSFILHASTVAIGETAVAFLGDSGAGKSSALAAMITQGFVGVTDDLTAIQICSGQALIQAGVPRMKLSAAVADRLELARANTLSDEESIFYFSSSNNLEPFPLQRLYILDYGPNWSIRPISQQRAIIELLRFSGLKSVLPIRNRHHFRHVSQLTTCVGVYQLQRPQGLDQLSQLPKFLKDHIREYPL
ncbi:hypothetical protein [Acaryochloris sp. IP29b_bin.137]|uniref:hypothetical protein n=1 Tax=Acaryochloris sp. IP29b_bin.137 TaxID=2969217 RepID=UPI0026159EF0|nr:hypothetical protein [Acaryochloris sp. IP29b_bin.137]